jgi:pimeloyl-ACP methyl ester carboxylesterase
MLQQPLVVRTSRLPRETGSTPDGLGRPLARQRFQEPCETHCHARLDPGRTDTVTPLWQGRQLQKLIPQAELSVLDNVGHIPYIENVKAFNDTLVGYLQAKH